MTRTTILSATVATALGLLALSANAQQQAASNSAPSRMGIAAIATMLQEQGYSVLEIEMEHGRYEVKMLSGDGMRVKAYLDPETGAVLPYRDSRKRWSDDDRYDDDDRWSGRYRD